MLRFADGKRFRAKTRSTWQRVDASTKSRQPGSAAWCHSANIAQGAAAHRGLPLAGELLSLWNAQYQTKQTLNQATWEPSTVPMPLIITASVPSAGIGAADGRTEARHCVGS